MHFRNNKYFLQFNLGFHQMGGEEALERYNICIGSNLTCMNNVMNQMGQFDHVDYHGTQMKCRYNGKLIVSSH